MYQVSFELASIVITLFCLIISLATKSRQYIPPRGFLQKFRNQHFLFLMLLICNLSAAISSQVGVYLIGRTWKNIRFWQFFFHECYFVFHSMLSFCFALYIMNVNGTTRLISRKPFQFLFFLPFAISEILVLTNPFTGLAFYMDGLNVYHRGTLMPVLYASGIIYLVLAFVLFLIYMKAIPSADRIAILSLMLVSTVGVALQALYSSLLVELFAESLTLLGVMMLLEDETGDLDPITGARNTLAFHNDNIRLMETHQSYSVILVRLTGMGRYAGLFTDRDTDRFLTEIVVWLETVVPRENVFRINREDFALLLDAKSDRTPEEIAQTVFSRFSQNWQCEEKSAQLDAAVSVIRIPDDVDSLRQLEDLITIGFQEKGKGSLLITYDELEKVKRNLAVEAAIRRAIQEGPLQVWYQPIWSSEKRRTLAAEALVRLNDPFLGQISPEEFVPIAERTGLIHDLGRNVFSQVCRFMHDNRTWEKGLEYIEVNLSVYQFMREDLAQDFDQLRTNCGLEAKQLNLEITESVSTDSVPSVTETIQQMTKTGYTFSLDDYGTGYSNLGRLISSEYKNVKIDKSILWDAERSSATAVMLDTLIRILRSLGMNVIQEGVETEAQLNRVLSSGCNLIQGYYFSRPLTGEGLLEYLRTEAAT